MDFSLSKDLSSLKAEACAAIDASAEQVRGLFITLGAGQSMVYLEKRREAEMVSADPSLPPAQVPNIAAEAQEDGISFLDKAAEVLTMSNNWSQISALIEVRRLATKEAVNAAGSKQAIVTARAVDWSDIGRWRPFHPASDFLR